MDSSRIMVLSLSSAIVIISFLVVVAEAEVQTSNLIIKAQTSNPVKIHGAYHYVGTVYRGHGSISWKGDCFQDNSATATIGVTYTFEPLRYLAVLVHLTAHYGKTWTCKDYYEFRVGGHTQKSDSIYLGGIEHEIEFGYDDLALHQRARENGVEIYMWRYDNNMAKYEYPKNSMKILGSYSLGRTMGYHASKENTAA